MAEDDKVWLTQEAYDRLNAELASLTGPWRLEIAKRIEAARAEGDLSENGGYQAAKDEQGKKEARIRELERLLRNVEVGVAPDDGKIGAGSHVKATIAGRPMEFLVGSHEISAGTDLRVYSADSPLGEAITGLKAGDKTSYVAPNGNTIAVVIEEVSAYQG